MPNTKVDQVCEVLEKHAPAVDSAAKWPEESIRAISDTRVMMPADMREFDDDHQPRQSWIR